MSGLPAKPEVALRLPAMDAILTGSATGSEYEMLFRDADCLNTFVGTHQCRFVEKAKSMGLERLMCLTDKTEPLFLVLFKKDCSRRISEVAV